MLTRTGPRLKRRRLALIALPSAAATLGVLALLWLPSGGAAAPAVVNVFPIPGSRVASPQSQIAFRGVPAGQLGAITVVGSRSGVHTGTVEGDSDAAGGSFLPSKPFTPEETVTVQTGLNVAGATSGRFQFTIANPAGGVPRVHWPAAPRVRNDVLRFRSRRDLSPASLSVSSHGATAPGDIFLAPQFGPLQDGPMIVDPSGGLIWFKPLPGFDSATDFRVQSLSGRPVLTWWQGVVTAGIGDGEDVINDTNYRQIAVVHAANGLSADLHEFQLTRQGTALLTAYYPVVWDASSAKGARDEIVLDSVVQEVDIPTGLVLFQWDSLDHVPVSDTYEPLPLARTHNPFDYFHVNSVEPDRDGNLVISGRNTFAAYKVAHANAQTIWTLGGKRSSFKMGSGASFAFQHDVRVRASNDLFVTIFDDGAGPPTVHSQSRGLKLFLDFKQMTAKNVAQLQHAPSLLANFEGNYQQLVGGDNFVGWGQQPYFSEYNSRGQLVLDGHFVDSNADYRAYRFPWAGTPVTKPAVAATSGSNATVYASWNGATNVAGWRVLGGSSPTKLGVLTTSSRRAFETAIRIRSQQYVAVQALDSGGHTLGTSATVKAS